MEEELLIFMQVQHLQLQDLFNKCTFISVNQFIPEFNIRTPQRGKGSMKLCWFPSKHTTVQREMQLK